jgi:hypothetical protein
MCEDVYCRVMIDYAECFLGVAFHGLAVPWLCVEGGL